jgi:Ubiquinol cytochrome reductase transmembrane region
MGSADGAFDKDRIPKKAGDPTRREFTYFMLGGARFIYASSARLALIKVMNIAFAALFEMSKRNMIGKEKIDVMAYPDL